MEFDFETFSVRDAREIAKRAELSSSFASRWRAVMKDIRDAAAKGYWELAIITEMDIVLELKKAGFQVQHASSMPQMCAFNALVVWK